MRSGILAPLVAASVLVSGASGALAQVPDLPPINEGPIEASPQVDPGGPRDSAFPDPAPLLPPVARPPLDVDRVMDRVKTCWTGIPVVYGTPAQGGVARLRIKFLPDGRLDGPPMIIDKPQGELGMKFAAGAARAIEKCQPYGLPPERYAEWRQIEMKFDTIDPDNPPPLPPPAPAPAATPGLSDLPPADAADPAPIRQ